MALRRSTRHATNTPIHWLGFSILKGSIAKVCTHVYVRVCVFVCVSARALFPLHPAPLQLMPHLELPMCRSDGLQLPISIFRLLLLLLQNPVQIAQHLLLFVLHGSVFPFLSFTSFSPLFCLLSPSTGPAWTHQCFPFRSSRLDTERQKERGPRLLNPTPFLCWASWCLCVLYICVCVCLSLCVCVFVFIEEKAQEKESFGYHYCQHSVSWDLAEQGLTEISH